jgi:hypothetical protein
MIVTLLLPTTSSAAHSFFMTTQQLFPNVPNLYRKQKQM